MKRNREVLELRGSPIMAQMAGLQSAINQYNQINSVMPQLQAEISTLQWLYSVMNKGELALQSLNQNIPIRIKDGSMQLLNKDKKDKADDKDDDDDDKIDYAAINRIAGDPGHPMYNMVTNGINAQAMTLPSGGDKNRRRRRTSIDSMDSFHSLVPSRAQSDSDMEEDTEMHP